MTPELPWLVFEPGVIAGLAVASVLYVRALRTLSARGRRTSPLQPMCFFAGLLLVAASLLTVLDPLGARYLLSAHMAQHLLMADLAGPLLLIGVRAPVVYFFWPRPVLVAVAGLKPLRRAWSFISRPVPALSLWLLTLYVWHLEPFYEAALRSGSLHVLEHMTFVFTGVLAWWPLLDPTHHRVRGRLWKVAYVVVARVVGGILGILLLVIPHQIYDFYGDTPLQLGIDPLTDQQIAGAMMMAVDFVVVTAGFFYFVSLLSGESEAEDPASS